jgi:Secretion system C-terminal sorting domain
MALSVKRVVGSLLLLLLMMTCGVVAHAQLYWTSINQNFDVACVLDVNFPLNWKRFNPLPETNPQGLWYCTPENGRENSTNTFTPGLKCTGYYDNDFHVDTAYLILPRLNLNGYAGRKIFLQFDARTSAVADMSKLSVFKSDNEIFNIGDADIDTNLISPKLNNPADTLWHTYQLDMTSFITSESFYLGFRYISTTGHGSIWYLDNMLTKLFRTGVPVLEDAALPLNVMGTSTREQIKISYSVRTAGKYELLVYDMMGRTVYKETLEAPTGISDHTISGLNLTTGMYFVKMGNAASYGAVKTIVQ